MASPNDRVDLKQNVSFIYFMFCWKLLNRVKEVKKSGGENAHDAKRPESKAWKIKMKKKKNFRNLTYQLNQHNEYNKYPDHAVRGWHPAAE